MSFLTDFKHSDITSFSGPNLLIDEEDVREPQCLAAKNIEFIDSQVRAPRRGFTQVWNPDKILRVMYNWLQSNYNRLIYLNSDNQVISRDLSSGAESVFITAVSAVGMAFAQAGYRLYMSFFDAAGFGTQSAEVWDGTFTSGTPNVDPVFPPPPDVTVFSGGDNWGAFSEPGAGSVSPGKHYYALIFNTWNGYQMAPGPLDSLVFTPRSFVSAGAKNLQLTVSPSGNWPAILYSVQLAMTTAQNPNRWFLLPSTNGGGPTVFNPTRGFGSSSFTFTIDIDDVTLTGGGPTEITNTLFNLYYGSTQPHCILAYNNRNIYITRMAGFPVGSVVATIMVSNPFAPQYVTANLHFLNLPEFRDAVTGFVLGTVLFILGPSWTYAFTDNGQVPVKWAPPRLVSGAVGSTFIHGVSHNQDLGYAWVADHSGLYFFTGSVYPRVPASYWQTPDWNRINFNAPAGQMKVIEVVDDRLVLVKAPLDGATEANYIMAWDYTDGTDANKIKYCGLWSLAPFPGIGDIEIVQAYTTRIKQLWISRGDANGQVVRRKTIEDGDATATNPAPLYDDLTQGIDGSYEMLATAPLMRGGKAPTGPYMQIGIEARLRGAGQINITGYSFDEGRETPLAPILASEISMRPGQRFVRLVDEQTEVMSYSFDNGAVANAFLYLAALRCYFAPWMQER